jgi:hypothetical protein
MKAPDDHIGPSVPSRVNCLHDIGDATVGAAGDENQRSLLFKGEVLFVGEAVHLIGITCSCKEGLVAPRYAITVIYPVKEGDALPEGSLTLGEDDPLVLSEPLVETGPMVLPITSE